MSSNFSTLALHTPCPEESWNGGAERHLIQPITVSATFELPTGVEIAGEPVYGRYGHPSRDQLEAVLSQLEGAQHCLTFASGMAAAHAVLQTLRPGDHIVAGKGLYGGVLNLIRQMTEIGIKVTYANGVSPEVIAEAVEATTKLVWLEVCTNPTIQLLDVTDTVGRVKSKNPSSLVVVDNTFLSPWVVKPLALGVDIVMHSVTKYINGHSDVIMGALLCNNKDVFSKLKSIQRLRGATPSPFDCFLVMRSLATLELRMEKHMKNGLAVANFLSNCPEVQDTQHPLLQSHSEHELALVQHSGRHSGMLSFRLSSRQEAASFLSSLKLVRSAASLGSSHSLACQPALLTHAMCTQQERDDAGVTDELVRLSVGLEDPEDIIKDITQALQNMK